ncbi:MAG: exodeoxyribonuclease III [Gammaproteobacteria bacterium]
MPKVASWNVNSLRARHEHVTNWLAKSAVDVLAVQETKVQDSAFPVADFAAMGYQCLYKGQKSYNGVAVVSRLPQTLHATTLPGFEDPQARVLAVEIEDFLLLDLYVPNGASVGSDKYAYKLAWLDALVEWVARLLEAGRHLLVVGDFNIAPADADVHDPEAWRGKVLCSDAERERLQRLFALGLVDTFRRFEQPERAFSWWDYRAAGFRRNHGLRIDLILASAGLAGRVQSCAIDIEPRRWEKPSDHAPVLATLSG